MLPDKSVVYESDGCPKVTLARVAGVFDLVLEVEGLDPYRTTTAEERGVGISSLDPPTVQAKTLESLISSGSRAMQAAIFATPGEEEIFMTSPGDLAMIHYRTSRAIRHALRLIDEDI
jgi:hypothetical protein